MVHKCRVQGAGDPRYYDRVEKLKQSMPWLIICECTVFLCHQKIICRRLACLFYGADVKIMDRFFRHREVPDSENFSKPGFQLKTA